MPKDIEIPKIDEIAGYVNQERAMSTMGITSSAYLAELVRKGVIQAVEWNSRTLMYDKRSVEKYRRERAPRKPKESGKSPRTTSGKAAG
jgi:hypothetical protein